VYKIDVMRGGLFWEVRIRNAHVSGYLTARQNETRAYRTWYAHCRVHRLPFVYLRPARTRAVVTLWMTHAGRELTQAEQDAAAAYDYAGGTALVVSATEIVIAGVPRADADRVAAFLRLVANGTGRCLQ
jgi:hypothetical protein